MKKNIVIITIALLLIMLPTLVKAEGKYEIIDFVKNDSQNFYTYNSYEYKSIIGITDKHIFIAGNGATYRLDKETLQENISLQNYTYNNLQMADNILYKVQSRNNNSIYYMDFITYDLNFDNNKTISIDYGISTNSLSINSFVYNNGYYYVSYSVGSYSNRKYYIIIFDKNGTIISNEETGLTSYLTLYNLNNNVFATTSIYNSSKYDSTIYQVSKDGEITQKVKLDGISITKLDYGYSEFLLLGTDYSKESSSVLVVKIFNEKFEETKSKDISNITNYIYYLDGNITTNGEEYILFNNNTKQLNVLDKDLELSYQVDCAKNLLYTDVYHGPYNDDGTIYIVGGYGIQNYSTDPAGNFIIKLENPSIAKEYTISTRVIAGEGTIEASKEKSPANENITFKATPAKGYEVKEINVITENDKNVTFSNNSFTMPEANVIIEVEFSKTEVLGEEGNNKEELPKEDIPNEKPEEKNPETSVGISLVIIVLIISSIILFIKFKKKYDWEN